MSLITLHYWSKFQAIKDHRCLDKNIRFAVQPPPAGFTNTFVWFSAVTPFTRTLKLWLWGILSCGLALPFLIYSYERQWLEQVTLGGRKPKLREDDTIGFCAWYAAGFSAMLGFPDKLNELLDRVVDINTRALGDYAPPEMELRTSGAPRPGTRVCPMNHPLALTEFGKEVPTYYISGPRGPGCWRCSHCSTLGRVPRLHCNPCKFDICQACLASCDRAAAAESRVSLPESVRPTRDSRLLTGALWYVP